MHVSHLVAPSVNADGCDVMTIAGEAYTLHKSFVVEIYRCCLSANQTALHASTQWALIQTAGMLC